jgi:hypothetical protein
MKQLAADWAEPFRSVVQNISADTEATSINIEDWLPPDTGAHGQGRMLLMGDAAHTMTMCALDPALFPRTTADNWIYILLYSPWRRRQPSRSRCQ